MSDLVHKVGVVFHASDRITRTTDKIGKGLIGLTDKQKAFESAQKKSEQTARQLQATETKLQNAKMRTMTLTTQAAAAEKARYMDGVRFAKLRANAEKEYGAARERVEREFTMMQKKHEEERLALTEGYAKRRALIEKEYSTQMAQSTSAAKGYGTARLALQNKLASEALNNKARSLGFGSTRGAVSVSASELSRLGDAHSHTRAALTRLESGKEDAVQAVLTRLLKDKPKASQEDRDLAESRARGYAEKQISGLRKELSLLDKKIAFLTQVEDLTAREAHLGVEITQQLELQETILARAFKMEQTLQAERKVALDEMTHQQMALEQAKIHGDEAAIQREKVLYEEKLTHLQTITDLTKQQATLQNEALVEQRSITAGLVTEHEKLATLLVDEVGLTEKLAGLEARRAAIAKQLQKSASMAASGVGMMGGGLLGVGALFMAGNKAVKGSAEFQMEKQGLRNTLAAQPGMADAFIAQVKKNDTRMPNNVRMTSAEQLHIIQDLVSSGLDTKHVPGALNSVASLVTLSKLTGKDKPKELPQQVATIYERLGFQTPEQMNDFNESYAKGAAVSKRLSMKYMAALTAKVAPTARAMHVNMNDMPFYDLMASNNPSGAQASTNLNSFLIGLARGGSNKTNRAITEIMMRSGFLTRGSKPSPLMVPGKNGKDAPYLDDKGKPIMMSGTASFHNMTFTQILSQLRSGILKYLKIDPKHFYGIKNGNNIMTPAETAKLSQFTNTYFNGRQGLQIMQPALDPVQYSRQVREQKLWKGAPGMTDQLKKYDQMYNMGGNNLTQAAGELSRVLGDQLRGPMREFIKQLTQLADWTRDFIKNNPKVVPVLFEITKWFAILTVGAGAFKIALAGLSLLTGSLGKKIGAAFVGHLWATFIASKVGTKIMTMLVGHKTTKSMTASMGTGLGRLFVGALASTALRVGFAVALLGLVNYAFSKLNPKKLMVPPSDATKAAQNKADHDGTFGAGFEASMEGGLPPPHKSVVVPHAPAKTPGASGKISSLPTQHHVHEIRLVSTVPQHPHAVRELAKHIARSMPHVNMNTPAPFAPVMT